MVIYYVVACIIACLAVPDIRALLHSGQLPFRFRNGTLQVILAVVYAAAGLGVGWWLTSIKNNAKIDFGVSQEKGRGQKELAGTDAA